MCFIDHNRSNHVNYSFKSPEPLSNNRSLANCGIYFSIGRTLGVISLLRADRIYFFPSTFRVLLHGVGGQTFQMQIWAPEMQEGEIFDKLTADK